jgi:hypothetical protein
VFDEYKNKMGYYIFKKKMLKTYDSTYSFKKFIENSVNYILIMPLNDLDFNNSFDVAKYFRIHKKNVTLLIPEHKVNSLNISAHYDNISYSIEDITKFGLPTKSYIQKLNEHEFDVLIDLERDDNLFLTAVTSLINAKYKVGFKKAEIDNLYNFQMVNTKINSEISYRNLLNSLKMF